jgi:hypothetical protein
LVALRADMILMVDSFFPTTITNHQHPQGSAHTEHDKTILRLGMIWIWNLNRVIIIKNRLGPLKGQVDFAFRESHTNLSVVIIII